MKLLTQSFYNENTIKIAQKLLGCFLVRQIGKENIKTRIVETEAYCGLNDLASHASKGITERNRVMFGEAGIIYIYLIYGMYNMFNIVTEKNKYPAAVLIRALEPIEDLGFKIYDLKLNGPGKLTKALKINKKFNGLEIYKKTHGLWIETGEKLKKPQIKKVPRVGVDYAGEYKNKLWRFYIKDNKFVSKK